MRDHFVCRWLSSWCVLIWLRVETGNKPQATNPIHGAPPSWLNYLPWPSSRVDTIALGIRLVYEFGTLQSISSYIAYRYFTFYLSIYQLINICVFLIFNYYELCCYDYSCAGFLCEYTSSGFLGIYLRVILLSHMVSKFWGTGRLFFKVCIATKESEFQFLNILSNSCYCLPFVCFFFIIIIIMAILGSMEGLPGGISGKESGCHCEDTRDLGLIPAPRRSPGGGCSNSLFLL